jgi:hypothetical protein
MAPEGCESFYVLSPVPALGPGRLDDIRGGVPGTDLRVPRGALPAGPAREPRGRPPYRPAALSRHAQQPPRRGVRPRANAAADVVPPPTQSIRGVREPPFRQLPRVGDRPVPVALRTLMAVFRPEITDSAKVNVARARRDSAPGALRLPRRLLRRARDGATLIEQPRSRVFRRGRAASVSGRGQPPEPHAGVVRDNGENRNEYGRADRYQFCSASLACPSDRRVAPPRGCC